MNVIGVVGEFNPFHYGHYEHLQESRKLIDYEAPVVCVMSGDFIQRGGPAAFCKHTRAEAAALCGADLVFELPLPWCGASAERFALGAVGL
ncbi:MAG: nucleotidyltransferase family protein, partial [Oscillospiraceae bacterium]|nr:nucleotidyltransferase family protein [Oscillospiraceae bacterium]